MTDFVLGVTGAYKAWICNPYSFEKFRSARSCFHLFWFLSLGLVTKVLSFLMAVVVVIASLCFSHKPRSQLGRYPL